MGVTHNINPSGNYGLHMIMSLGNQWRVQLTQDEL